MYMLRAQPVKARLNQPWYVGDSPGLVGVFLPHCDSQTSLYQEPLMLRLLVQTVGVAGGFILIGSLLAAAMFSRQPAAAAQEAASGGSLRHVVLFKFKPEATKEQIDEIVAGFQQLPKKIDGITAFEWGTDNSPEGFNEGFTHCFVVSFKDAKSRDTYLPHQAHRDFVAILLPRLEKVLVVDYFAQK
jgi:hypothetical protein